MLPRHLCFQASLSALLLLVVCSLAHAQGTGTTGSTTPDTAAADTDAAEKAEPEWRWRFLSVGGDVGMTSQYVWRGFVLHDGACVQPDLWVKMGDFTVTTWSNVRGAAFGDARFNEHDLIVDYSREIGRGLTFSAGWTNYRFFGHDSGASNEFYAGLQADAPLQPGVQVYRDIGEGNGTYISLSAGHEFPLRGDVTGGVEVALGYNNHLYVASTGLSDLAVTFKISLPVPSARVALQPTLTYSRSLMTELLNDAGDRRYQLYGGLLIALK